MKEIAKLDVSDNKRLILSIGEFRGDERVDLRQYVKVNDKYIPTPKGINFNAEWLPGFIKMIGKLEDV
ncbi:hypothetical protein ES702_02243 [subsurface metagenome]